jgi:Tat protein secretion system quality control protein TatD with DNase activity
VIDWLHRPSTRVVAIGDRLDYYWDKTPLEIRSALIRQLNYAELDLPVIIHTATRCDVVQLLSELSPVTVACPPLRRSPLLLGRLAHGRATLALGFCLGFTGP